MVRRTQVDGELHTVSSRHGRLPAVGELSIANRQYQASIVPYRSYQTLDGDILFGGGNDRLFGVLCDRLGFPEWKTDPRFITNRDRVKHREELDGLIEKVVKLKTTQEWLEILEGSGMPYAAINDIQGTLNHSHGKSSDDVSRPGEAIR